MDADEFEPRPIQGLFFGGTEDDKSKGIAAEW